MQFITKETGYYLPLGYNDNKIVLLVKNPTCLYAYWEISHEKKDNFINEFGQEAWNNSRPVLKVTNITQSKVQYVEIKDYAINWFLDVNQPNCVFCAEIGRLFSSDLFVALASSNSVHTPIDKPSTDDITYFASFEDVTVKEKITIKTDLGKYENTIDSVDAIIHRASAPGSGNMSGLSSHSLIR